MSDEKCYKMLKMLVLLQFLKIFEINFFQKYKINPHISSFKVMSKDFRNPQKDLTK